MKRVSQRIARLSAEDYAAIRAYWAYFTEQNHEVLAQVQRLSRDLPGWKPVAGLASEAEEHALEHAAVTEGAWEPYLEALRARGEAYAAAGIDFWTWSELVRLHRDLVRHRLLAMLEADPEKNATPVTVIGNGMTLMLDLRTTTIGNAFFQSERKRLEMTQAAVQHSQKMDALGRLAGGIAHDFNNILTVVMSYACLLEESLEPGDTRQEDATAIRNATERAVRLTRRLLALGRQSDVTPMPVVLDALIAEFLPIVRRLVGSRVRVLVQPAADVRVVADSTQFEQVLMNLAVNARDAMDEEGTLTIESSIVRLDGEAATQHGLVPGRYVVVAVTDTGAGIPVELQSKIFEPFFTTKDVGRGTGLGLSIVHGIVAQAGGTITVFSRLGHGTTFRVYWPTSEDAVAGATEAVEAPVSIPTLPAVTVLVVDDDVELRTTVTRVLEDAGCTVLAAASSGEARRLCVSHEGVIACAVIDVVLADGRGDLLARELQELRPALRVLLTSGFPAGALEVRTGPATDFLGKPFRPAQLRDAVARLVATPGTVQAAKSTLQPRVLVVDDDPDMRKMLSRLLRRAAFDVTDVESGRKALAEIEKQRFDVVLSDVHMQDGDGLEVLRGVRKIDLDLPVILISGKPDVASATTALEYGAFRYLTKPLDTGTVERLVRLAVRAHEVARLRRQAFSLGGGVAGASDRAGLEVRFDAALAGLWMAYQPIVDARSGALFGVEALMRTKEPTLPHPGAILEAAIAIDRLPLLARRTRQLAGTALAQRTDIPSLFINLHPADLHDVDLSCADAPLTAIASRVILEVTEREAIHASPKLVERLARLRELGFRIAVDDIGAGYSGLASFADLAPEVVKIDMSLVRSIHTSVRKQRTVGALCALCHEVDALVVAEGVETTDERDCVVELGCDLLQGYYIARPSPELPAAE